MVFNIRRDNLKGAVLLLRSVLEKDDNNPLYLHFLFELKDKKIKVTSTNGRYSLIWERDVDSYEEVKFTIPGITLGNLVATLDSDIVSFNYNEKTKDVKLTCGTYVWETASGVVADFPIVSIPSSLKEILLPRRFNSMLKDVFFSISDDKDKVDCNSLCIDLCDKENKISLYSTDRHRLSLSHCEYEIDTPFRFLIRKKAVSKIMKLEPTTMCFSQSKDINSVYFKKEDEMGSFVLQTVLTDALFPEIHSYLGNAYSDAQILTIPHKSNFVRICKRMRLTTDPIKKECVLSIKDNELSLISGGDYNKSLDVFEVKSNITKSFQLNLDYLLEYLNLELNEEISLKVAATCVIFNKRDYRHFLAMGKDEDKDKKKR